MTIVYKLLYIDSYYLASMVIFSNVLKQLFGKKLFQNNFSPRIIKVVDDGLVANPLYLKTGNEYISITSGEILIPKITSLKA